MMQRVMRRLAVPVGGDEEEQRHVRLLNAVTLSLAATALVVMIGNWIGGRVTWRVYAAEALIVAAALTCRWLALRGSVITAGITLIVSTFALITAVVVEQGTVRSPAGAAYVLIVIAAGLLFGVRGMVTSTFASSLAIGVAIVAERMELLAPADYTVTATQWITYTVLFVTTGGLLSFALKTSAEALARAGSEIEDRRRAEDDIRKLLLAVEQSPASILITALDGTIEYVNRRFTLVTGYTFEEAIGKNPRILKTDQTPAETYQSLWETLAQGREWQGEFVNRKKDGSTYPELATVTPIVDSTGAVTHYLAVKEDITERKRAEQALRESEARFRSLFEQTHDAVFILDLEGRHVMANQRAAEMFGYGLEELGRLRLEETSAEVDQSRQVMTRLLAGEIVPLYERTFRRSSGDVFPAEVNVELVRDRNGAPLHIQSVMRDISHRKLVENALKAANDELSLRLAEVEHLHGELRQQALHDPLTGLHNRRYLTETLPREIARADRSGEPLSIVVADLDHFKEINDLYGHATGDELLVEVARILRGSTRGADLVCRHGGEEFLLVLPGAGTHAAERRAEEIRRRCERTIIRHDGRDLTTTMSLGVATYPDDAKSSDELIALADKAMYRSKRAGRNRVTVWAAEAVSAETT